jgi:ketosteroid isomerase-like protein
VDDGTWEALARYDYTSEQEFQGARYTRHDMRVRVRCNPELPMVTTVSDSLRRGDAVVSGHYYGATAWASIGESTPPNQRWPLELCRRIAPSPADSLPAALRAARDGYVVAWQGTDRAALAAFFAEDAKVIFPDYTLEGRAQIEERWLAEDVGKVSGLVMTPGRVTRGDGEVTESGTVTLRFRGAGGEVRAERGTYEHVWARQADSAWKLRSVRMETHPAAP